MKVIIWLMAALLLNACTSVQHNQAQILNRQNNISLLKNRLDQGIANQVDLLAPNAYDQAQKLFQTALRQAERSRDPNAGDNTAKEGLLLMDKAENAAIQARQTFSTALAAEKAAFDAQAHVLYPAEFEKLEKSFRVATKQLEEGQNKAAIEKNAILANQYTNLQLRALKTSISEQAQQAYQQAVHAGANRLAPITLKNAKHELDIAKKILEVEKGNYEKAQFHANRAKYLALRAKYISELIVGFRTDKKTEEQILLWYQDQLTKIHKPLPEELNFDKPNNEVVASFENDLANHLTNLKEAETRALGAEKKIAVLSDKLQAGPGRTLMEQATWEENFREISKMFSKKEAQVLRSGNKVIIRASGFYFPVGKSDLDPRNFTLLNKILNSVLKFPHSHIEVQGHTDATGSKSLNMKLSEERAQNVADFLVKVGGIDASRISNVGMGGEKPVASNKTAAGRELNRRIDVIITR